MAYSSMAIHNHFFGLALLVQATDEPRGKVRARGGF